MGKKRITYGVLMRKRAAKRPFGRLRRAQDYSIVMGAAAIIPADTIT
jgi:hypothetical protein